jgi:pimeloyl-ACP methyl ester carboxylesterase
VYIYLISGLGADRTVFKNLTFKKGTQLHYLDWIPPVKKESLRSYALRMAESIDHSIPFSVIGLSFGGMLATEMAAILNPQTTVLLSSAPVKQELPKHFHFFSVLKLNKIFPALKLNYVPRFITSLFGVESRDDHLFFLDLLRRTDPKFSKWAMGAILEWDRTESPKGLVRIHGTKDRILPIGNAKIDYPIKDAGHFMVYNRAGEISKILAVLGF